MTESPFEFFSNLITRQAILQQLHRCTCGRRPVVVEDILGKPYWVGCKMIRTANGLIGCGIGWCADTEAEAMTMWQEDANNK